MDTTHESVAYLGQPERVELSEAGLVFANYKAELAAWYEREGSAAERPRLCITDVPESERSQLTPADIALLPIDILVTASHDEDIRQTLTDETRQALDSLTSDYRPHISPLHVRAARWLVEMRRKFSFDESPAGTPEGEENVWMAAARRPQPLRQPRHNTAVSERGAWVMEATAMTELDAYEQARATYDRLDANIAAARKNLQQAAAERKRAQQVEEDRQRLTAKRERLVAEVVQSRKFGWVVAQIAAEFPTVVEGVIKTVEVAREEANQRGTFISDRTVYAAYRQAVEGDPQPSRDRILAFCTMHALVDGDPEGPLPASLAV